MDRFGHDTTFDRRPDWKHEGRCSFPQMWRTALSLDSGNICLPLGVLV
jgi:hypothetical protein